jgi:tetratricopeptide (TPR) repeat protein
MIFNKTSRKKSFALTGLLLSLIVIFYATVFGVLDDWSRGFVFIETPFFEIESAAEKWASIISAAGYYLKLLVYPYPLCCYYGFNQIPVTDWLNWTVYTSAFAYAALIYIAISGLRKPSLKSFGAIIILCDLALFVNVLYPYPGILGERVLFGSTLGISLMLVGTLTKVKQNEASTLQNLLSSSKVISAVFLLILGMGSWLTINRNSDWKDRLTLFTVDAKNCAKSVKLQQLYAHHLRQEYLDNPETFTTAQANEVLRAYQKGIDLYDAWPITHYGAGNVLFFDLGNAQRAVPYYLKAVELNPKYADAQYDLLNAYLELGDFENAEKIMNVLIGIFPEDESLFDRVLKGLFTEVQFNQAERINQQFLEAFPKLDLPYIYQGNVNIAKGDTLGALLHFEQALEFNPNNADLEGYLNYLKQELNN